MLEQPTRRMAELISTLLQQTRAGAIVWKATDLPGAFLYAGANGSVVVRGPADTLSSIIRGVSIQVLDERGDKVEVYSESWPAGSQHRELQLLFQLISERYAEGNPLLDRLREEISAARP